MPRVDLGTGPIIPHDSGDQKAKKSESSDHISSEFLNTKVKDQDQSQTVKLSFSHHFSNLKKGLSNIKEKISDLYESFQAGVNPEKKAALLDKKFTKRFMGTREDIQNMSDDMLLESLKYTEAESFPKFLEKLSLDQLETLRFLLRTKIHSAEGQMAVRNAEHSYFCENASSMDDYQFNKAYLFYQTFSSKDINLFEVFLDSLPNHGVTYMINRDKNFTPNDAAFFSEISNAINREHNERKKQGRM